MRFHNIYYLLLIIVITYPTYTKATFDKTAFDRAAALYGNKTANLIELQKNY